MPLQPLRQDLHVNRPLTNVSVAYIQDQNNFIADKVFPIVPVKKQSDRYVVYTKDYWFRTVAAKRAPASESVGTGYRIDNTPQYVCDVWAVHHDVPIEDYENADDPIDPDADATELVTHNLLLRREKLFMSQYMSTGIWTGFQKNGSAADYAPNVDGNGFWSSPTSNPILDIAALRSGMRRSTGIAPNTLVLTDNVYTAIKNHPMILQRILYNAGPNGAIVTEQLLASLFDVDRVFVAGAVINNAQEGQVANMNFMANNGFLLCYAAPAPGIRRPSAGYTFAWTGRVGAGALGNTIERFYMQEKKAYRIEGEMAFAMAQVGKDLGVFGTSVLSA